MATITKTVKENQESSNKATWTITLAGENVSASDDFTLPAPNMTAKYVFSGKNKGLVGVYLYLYSLYYTGDEDGQIGLVTYEKGQWVGPNLNPVSMASGTVYTIGKSPSGFDIQLADLFNSGNPSVGSVDIIAKADENGIYLHSDDANGNKGNEYLNASEYTFGTIAKVTLVAPPTFDVSVSSSGAYYSGIHPYSVAISNCSAKYGGTISETKLTIGGQSTTGSGNGTLSIIPNAVGTFTPVVTVTDSRGQVTTKTLPSITVLPHSVDITAVTAQRINASTGLLDDEGTNALITATITYSAFSGNYLLKPDVMVGGVSTNNVTWYSSWTASSGFSNPISWTNYAPTSPVTLYGKCTSSFNKESSYEIGVTPKTTYDTGTDHTATLAQAFYTICVRAGGHGIGFGMKPPTDDFHVGMDVVFHKDFGAELDVVINSSTGRATAGEDKDLYNALVDLGWVSEVIE